MSDIFCNLANPTKLTLKYTFDLLTRSNNALLTKWAERVDHSSESLGKMLLQDLALEDRTNVLFALYKTFACRETHPAFTDLLDLHTDGGESIMNTHEIAQYIFENNQLYDEEGEPNGIESTALDLWARWLEGDREVEKSLMYALTHRFWRIATQETIDYIHGLAFFAHAYAFYYLGQSKRTAFKGVRAEHMEMLAGKTLKFASDHDFNVVDPPHVGGSFLMDCVPRVHHETWESVDLAVIARKTLKTRSHSVQFLDFGDDGIAIKGEVNGHEMGYFLLYPYEFEDGIASVWEHL
jgi:hypothetical protein